MRVTLVLTHQCNLACTYCYAGDKFDRTMPDPVAWKALAMAFRRAPSGSARKLGRARPDVLDQHEDNTGPVRVSFFGGEPMLEFARMARWTRLAARLSRETGRDVEFSLTTNGTVMQDKHVRFFQHYRFHVAISLDGAGEAHDKYRPFVGGRPSSAAVWRGVERAAPVLDRLSVLMVLNPDTVAAVPDAVERLHALDVARVLLVPNLDDPWDNAARDNARAVYHELARRYVALREADRPLYVHPFVDLMRRRLSAASSASGSCSKNACGFGLDEVAVAPSGRLYPCARLVGTDTRRDILLGDVSRGVDIDRVTAVRDRAIAVQTRCGNEGECLCVPMMPATSDSMMDGAKFFEKLSVEALDVAMGMKAAHETQPLEVAVS